MAESKLLAAQRFKEAHHEPSKIDFESIQFQRDNGSDIKRKSLPKHLLLRSRNPEIGQIISE